MEKKELRKNILAARMAQSDKEVTAKSRQVLQKLKSLPEFEQAGVIMFYLDFRKEVQTGELISECLANGKRVVIPITDRANTALIPSELKEFPGDLTSGTWGILEPKADRVRPVEPGEINFVVVPGVSFDPKGNRLGYGGGFYDRFLLRTKPGATFAALAFEMQIKDDVHPEEHDHPVHYVITEERLMDCRNRA